MPRPVSNPPNPWHGTHVELLGPPPPARLQIFEEHPRSIVTENDSPDLGFRFGLNPYRGCFHGCAYCYARPTHQYLDWGAGTDFERRLVVKLGAPELLRKRLQRPSWTGEVLHFSGVTDCYQPLEASYELTRRCLEVCLEFRQPVGIVTKGALVRRDADLLGRLAREARATVFVSIPYADDETGRKLEPWASSVSSRFESLRILAEAGVTVGVGVAPIIPGLSESHIPAVLERARAAGATRAFSELLRLPGEVLPVFTERLREAYPLRAEKVLAAVREMRGGRMNSSVFGARMRGQGPRWTIVADLFVQHCRRLGLETGCVDPPPPTTFRRPGSQGELFERL